jgi:cobalt/nickel transport system permease protein
MNQMEKALSELHEMDELAARRSFVHDLNALAKLLTTIAYILTVVSFDKYDLSGLFPLILYPAIVFQLSGIAPSVCFRKLRFVLPLVLAVGLFNPFFDREIVLTLGSLPVSGGVISMLTLMLKGVLALTASFLLMATTGIDGLCAALRQLHVPGVLVTLLLLTYRYVGVMTEEVGVMTTAYHLRAPGQKGIHHSAWGSFLGQLLLRSMDRAGELYSSMLLRGFRDEFPYAESRKCTWRDAVWFTLCTGAFLFCRFVNAAQLLGSLVVR